MLFKVVATLVAVLVLGAMLLDQLRLRRMSGTKWCLWLFLCAICVGPIWLFPTP